MAAGWVFDLLGIILSGLGVYEKKESKQNSVGVHPKF